MLSDGLLFEHSALRLPRLGGLGVEFRLLIVIALLLDLFLTRLTYLLTFRLCAGGRQRSVKDYSIVCYFFYYFAIVVGDVRRCLFICTIQGPFTNACEIRAYDLWYYNMSSFTQLYERLSQIPQDRKDLLSLDDLTVCAFGAFESYYVCWKNKAGDYKQGRSKYVLLQVILLMKVQMGMIFHLHYQTGCGQQMARVVTFHHYKLSSVAATSTLLQTTTESWNTKKQRKKTQLQRI
jgi:hypothetical protein